MNNKPLFHIASVSPDSTLLSRIVEAIQQKREESRLWRVRIFATSAALSVVALVPVVESLISSLRNSNFSTYLSLLFSDGGFFFTIWKDICASLLESLPVIAVMGTLALVGVLLWSLRSMVRFMNNSPIRTA
ncbi:MAG TPA: hypothetical protein VL576_03005 [Candidatus Paceibacterota bacterium]|jgi:hypothetical protein|nr:hypothetical protein [Candidatus Paceibacterota bacterium]